MERREESILCEIIPRKDYVLLFSFPSIAKMFGIPSLLEEGFFPSHYTVCEAAQVCRNLAFCLVLCSQELETVIWLLFTLQHFLHALVYLSTHSFMFPAELSEVQCALGALVLAALRCPCDSSPISRCHCSPICASMPWFLSPNPHSFRDSLQTF